ncbi:hypothetical protein GCM10011369_05520 [Neiella marina]|uniref:Uncharacterized protein n=1 Tax=Neiella marina TaxID=508461 RepID=A0A8J2U2F2_9GAMM|nr:hypothetical protein [Neiella marina]GGA66826.1 hypothetical protein GCM10011369_05520 [Neiella marina]
MKADDPEFSAGPDFKRDMVNVCVGIMLQTFLVVLPTYIVIREEQSMSVPSYC